MVLWREEPDAGIVKYTAVGGTGIEIHSGKAHSNNIHIVSRDAPVIRGKVLHPCLSFDTDQCCITVLDHCAGFAVIVSTVKKACIRWDRPGLFMRLRDLKELNVEILVIPVKDMGSS